MKVKIARIKKGLTQAQLRELVGGISLNTIVKIERGDVDGLKLGQAKKIAAVLDTTVQELFFKEG